MFKNIPHERLMIFFAAVVQAVGFIISITIEDFSASFIPYAEKIVPVVNFSGSLISFILVIFPQTEEAGAAIATGLARFIEMMIVLILSLEEYVRLGISLWLLFSRKWMKNLTKA